MFGDTDGAAVPATGVDGGDTNDAATEKDAVTLADDDAEIEIGGDEGEDEGDDDAEGEDKPRRASRSQRYKDKIARLERENEDLRRPVRRPAPKADELVAPKEADFPGDYLAFDRAMRTFETKKAIREEAQRDAEAGNAAEAEREHRQRVSSYNRHLDDVKDRIPDFDRVMADARSMEVRDDVRDLILESPKGPLIAYHLAKNPDKADEINRMTPTKAAQAIGSLEARIRGPKPKAATAAKPSPKPPKGGAGTPAVNPSKIQTNDEYRAWRAKQG